MDNIKNICTENIKIVNVNGVDLEVDLFDLEFAQRYEDGLESVQKEATKQSDKKIADVIKTQCTAVFNFFDDLFGEGTSEAIFGERVNLMACLSAFKSITDTIDEQLEETKPFLDEIKNKKDKNLNRAQRRLQK